MSNDPDFERRTNNKLEAILEAQARNDVEIAKILEAVAGMIQVVRSHEERQDRHEERLDRIERQTEENSRLTAEQRESINALIRIVEGHITDHPS
jgi:hypothetical protein